MFRHRLHVLLVAPQQERDLHTGQRTGLDTGLAARWGIAKIDEGELGAAQALLDQARAGVAGGPSVAAGHALRRSPLSVGRRMLTTIDWAVFMTDAYFVSLVSIVTPKGIPQGLL